VRPAGSPSPFSGQAAATTPAAGRALSRLARVPFARHPQGVALTGGARPAATLFPRLAGLGFWLLGAPGGRRERWPRPQPAQAARGWRLEREDGDGAGWAGG
jgi:hypothetical protein